MISYDKTPVKPGFYVSNQFIFITYKPVNIYALLS